MPLLKNDGTANLRADPKIKAAGGFDQADTSGSRAGGTANLQANAHLYSTGWRSPVPEADPTPGNVSHFRDGVV